MFPIMDVNNRVIGFGGRVMGDAKPKYLNSPETEVFDKSRNLYGLNRARTSRKPYFLICEGYMDVDFASSGRIYECGCIAWDSADYRTCIAESSGM